MKNLGKQYPSLSGYYPNPKPVTFSWGMSHLRLTGMFSPFTVEANYNRDIPDYEIPYTVCHELAHLKGWIREDEAGFIAYLACRESSDPALRYSGTLNALSYAMNALYSAGRQDSYWRIYESLPEQAKQDYRSSNAYWKQFETKVAEVSTALNDGYLKANAQSDGVQSYGFLIKITASNHFLSSFAVKSCKGRSSILLTMRKTARTASCNCSISSSDKDAKLSTNNPSLASQVLRIIS